MSYLLHWTKNVRKILKITNKKSFILPNLVKLVKQFKTLLYPKGCTEYISSVVGSSCSNRKTLVRNEVFSGHDCANLVRIWLAVSSELKFKNVLKFWFFKLCHHWVFECSNNWNFQVLSQYKPILGHLTQIFCLTDKRELLRTMWVIQLIHTQI